MELNVELGNKTTIYTHLIFDKIGNGIFGGGKSAQQIVLAKLDFSHRQIKLDFYFSPYTKNNSKWIKDLSLKL